MVPHQMHSKMYFASPVVNTVDKTYGISILSTASPTLSFTKGLPHHPGTGLLLSPTDYKLLVQGIQSGDPVDFRLTPLGPGNRNGLLDSEPSNEEITSTILDRTAIWRSSLAQNTTPSAREQGARLRAWESAGAGNVFDLEGPDAQAVTMPPAPRFDSAELLAEIAEVYAMALERDRPFKQFPLTGARRNPTRNSLNTAGAMLRSLDWFDADDCCEFSDDENARRRSIDDDHQLFRGVTPGEQVGPYLSQFLLLGNRSIERNGTNPPVRTPQDGFIAYGAIGIEQKVRIATPRKDYMTTWEQYVDVQNGADLRGEETYDNPAAHPSGHRYMATPRDLATYVHHDALYEAYLNACLFLLAAKAPFDRGIPFLEQDTFDKQQGFAHFGGPHILTLVTEVATRALKAVRYQKFNIHRRLRPEAMGGRIDRWFRRTSLQNGPLAPFAPIARGFNSLRWGRRLLRTVVGAHNRRNNRRPEFSGDASARSANYLLPMAFPEGSPMHPSYGAGHATVAGACVTILKAYFDHGWTPPEWFRDPGGGAPQIPVAFEPNRSGSALDSIDMERPLTVEGELNKLAANISIGRNWAGVHYYSDYIESMRMGEEIAIGLLEEQKLTYPENFTMTVPLFDGGAVRI